MTKYACDRCDVVVETVPDATVWHDCGGGAAAPRRKLKAQGETP